MPALTFPAFLLRRFTKKLIMKKKALNKSTIAILSVVAIIVAGAIALKVIADSESRVDY